MAELTSPLPQHIAIIPDGNRRWAKERGLPSLVGHKKGLERFRELAELAVDLKIPAITFWGFSTENWKRTQEEVGYLMKIFEELIRKDGAILAAKGAKLMFCGRMEDLPVSLNEAISDLVSQTSDNPGTVVNICVSYGGRDEILRAVKKMIKNSITADDVTEEKMSEALDTAGLPDIDLVIRTSGEQRMSGFMPWQTVYAELYFTPLFFPDFDENEFKKALSWYEERQRRFGR